MIKSIVRRLLPRRVRTYLELLKAYNYDARRFFRFSSVYETENPREAARAAISRRYHCLEKGLAMPEPRPGFGKRIARELKTDLDRFETQWGDDHVVHVAKAALAEYEQFNREKGVDVNWLVAWSAGQQASPPCGNNGDHKLGGTREICGECKPAMDDDTFSRFMQSRHSVRNFANQPVNRAVLEQAVRSAQYAPSVCNRQAPRVFIYQDQAKVRELLALQNGNRGFTDCINTLLVVTAQTDHFYSATERNQCWIDGGLFAMSLLLALHAAGLGTCCLNWCATTENDTELHRQGDIPDCDAVIMMMAVGYPKENLKVAVSTRKSLEEVAIFK